jgi:hypothetical protein
VSVRDWLNALRQPSGDTAPLPAPPAAPNRAAAAPPAMPALSAPAVEKVQADKPAAPRTVLVTTLGLRGDALDRVLETVIAECRQTRTHPLFITDASDFRTFRGRKALFEQVIDPAVCAARSPERDWWSYALHQYRLIGQKWRPVTIVAFGRSADPAFLDAVRQGSKEKL